MCSGSFKNIVYNTRLEIIYLIYMYKKDMALNNLQWLICHKTNPSQTIYFHTLKCFQVLLSTNNSIK